MIFTDKEISKFRSDTPGCSNVIHLNNAGASLMPTDVIDAIQKHIMLEANVGGYEAADLRAQEINSFYDVAATLFNCKASNIAFTANATDSFSRAISAIDFKPGDVILTSREDYISNQITYLAFAKRFGVKLIRAASLPSGGIDLEDFERCVKKFNPKLVAITHIPTNSGLIQPVEKIGAICKAYGVLYLVDACQSIGQLALNVQNIKCDFLSVTARKFLRGPRGAGFLYVSDNALTQGLEPLFIDMRGADWVARDEYIPRADAKRFEDWEFAYALLLGTKAAIEYLQQVSIAKIESQVKYLSACIRSALNDIDGVTTHDKGADLGALVTFHLKGSSPQFIKQALSKKKINVVTSIRNFAVIDYDDKGVDWTIRVSPHYFNTLDEIHALIESVKQIATDMK